MSDFAEASVFARSRDSSMTNGSPTSGVNGWLLPISGGDNSPQPRERPGLSDATPSGFLIFLIVAEKRVRGQRPGGSRPEMRSVVRVQVVASQVRNL
jgi:hypothetical protein